MSLFKLPNIDKVESDYDSDLRSSLDTFTQALLDAPFRAVGPKEYERVRDEIVLDSLAPEIMGVIPKKKKLDVVDIGCGAGIPSIPLAMMCPDYTFTGIDSTGKKIKFVRECVQRMGLNNIQFYNDRVPYPRKDRRTYDIVLSRGVGPLDKTLELAKTLLRRYGRAIVYSTPAAVEEVMKDWGEPIFKSWELTFSLYQRHYTDTNYMLVSAKKK
ncbi:MAG: class I SAM-dependent methyltransferase [Candidatus Lindowbacteria bacterium]|nr:class I SAM-dependent methyltransferase [Candidatus Lindowbacteria bacterium]